MESLTHDIRQALRMMWAHKGFTAAALLTLALGIGANAAVFSMVYGVLLRPLPYDEPDRLVRVSEEHPGANSPLTAAFVSDLTIKAWQPTAKTVEGIAAYRNEPAVVGRENPTRMLGSSVSPSLFRLLRVQPAVGTFFTDEQAIEGADGVAVISYRLWQDRFAGNPSAVGQTLIVDGRSRVIVGVAPQQFSFPATDVALWTPFVFPTSVGPSGNTRLTVVFAIARLRPGITPAQAATEGTAAARSQTRPFAADMLFGKGGPVQVNVRPVVDELTVNLKPALMVLMAGVALVLLVACANVANLFLARGQKRQREMAVRAALGAHWTRLARQLLTESLLFAVLGGAMGLLLAWVLVRTLPLVAPESFPRLESVQLDGRVLAFGALVSLAAGLLAGVLPAMRGARAGLESALRDGDRRATGGSGRHLRAGLLMIEAALAVVLIVGAALLVRSFGRLIKVDGGFTPENVLTAQVFLPPPTDPAGSDASMRTFYDTLLSRIRQMPGVAAASVANMAPFNGRTAIAGFRLQELGPDGKPTVARATAWMVTSEFGAALGLRLKQGRFLEAGDLTSATQALVINEEFAHRYFNDGKPVVGRREPGLMTDQNKISEIVGVVANVLKDGLDRQPQPEIYAMAGREGRQVPRQGVLLVRTTGDPMVIVPEVRRFVQEGNPLAALDGVGTLSDGLSASVAQPRFAALMLALFAVVALAVAATGLYGVLSYSVSERRREIGVRAALGATRRGLIALVLRQGLGFTSAGLALGLVAAAASSRFLSTLLFGVTPYDIAAFAIAPLTLFVVALVACLVPAWRAAATDPSEALRAE